MRILLLISFLCTYAVFSQIDRKKQPIRLELKSPFKKAKLDKEDNPNLPSLKFKSIFDKDDSYLKKYSILKKEEPKKSILDTSTDFKNPGDEIKDKLNGEIAKEGNWEDVFFGKFIVNTPIIKIMVRDFVEPDGDRVQIVLNNVVNVSNILLEVSYKTYYVDLREGENLLNIIALNQGLGGPNTANFAIYDNNGGLVNANDWNLNTGVAAKFIIEYIKPIDSNK